MYVLVLVSTIARTTVKMNTITMENSAIAIRRDDACLQQQQVTYEHNGQDINSWDQPLKNLKMQPFFNKRAQRALGCSPEEKGSSRFLQEDFQDFLYYSL